MTALEISSSPHPRRRGSFPSSVGPAGPRALLSRAIALAVVLLVAIPFGARAQEPPPAPAEEGPDDEGRRISEYDFAVSHAMRALMAAGAEQGRVTVYVARKEGDLWHVYFGSLDVRAPRFQVAYEVVQREPSGEDFQVRRYEEDVTADAELTRAALALVTSLDAFEPPTVSFHTYVWRDAQGRWVAYFAPAQPAASGTAPDVARRVVVTPDARRVLELRNLVAGGGADSAAWVAAAPPAGPGTMDFVNVFLRPHLAPLALVARRLVCEVNWRGRITSCLVAPIR